MNIITISREFGSGGRELGRRLADELGYDYYDGEIIAAIARKSGLDAIIAKANQRREADRSGTGPAMTANQQER